MVVLNGNGQPPQIRVSLALWVSLAGLMTGFSTAVGGVLWLGQMRADIDSNHRLVLLEQAGMKAAIVELQNRTERMDDKGTRALGDVKKDVGQVQGLNSIQDNRITRNDNRIDELIKNQTEMKFWQDQMREFMKSYARSPPP